MLGYVLENAVQRPGAHGVMIRHRYVVLSALRRRQPQMRALLPGNHIPKGFESLDEILP